MMPAILLLLMLLHGPERFVEAMIAAYLGDDTWKRRIEKRWLAWRDASIHTDVETSRMVPCNKSPSKAWGNDAMVGKSLVCLAQGTMSKSQHVDLGPVTQEP
ncbi:hypothetical protein BBK36DRAFT_1144357 [Trichoderma citrinoviride]|uniref:Secreted protein n=1 Tax=Trichoderma citrinoviride TaxID=58853 RepID=A0A2T4B0H0_9HYPO|nr:hypothetical protein BBK36DRAFT_1144357 [Trichoderma citrinoviride]PTB62815.1 hypothetical protein BBK36DRAFT_1144357 [Trichoderma citrinoviride]